MFDEAHSFNQYRPLKMLIAMLSAGNQTLRNGGRDAITSFVIIVGQVL